MYRVTIDRDACEGIFACLIRDSRFVEDDEGLATVDSEAGQVTAVETDGQIVVAFDDDGIETARAAAAACPPGAIDVQEADAETDDVEAVGVDVDDAEAIGVGTADLEGVER